MALLNREILLGVAGGIAAYKAAELIRLLRGEGAQVSVVMTRSAQQFITPLTLQTLAGRRVALDTFDLAQEAEIGHIALADRAEAVVLAPATANLIGKLAAGIADDLLTTVLLATRAPVLVAPGMNVHMYEHPAVQENLQRLRARGYRFVGPEEGGLACGYEGLGRLAAPEAIVEGLQGLLASQDLAGERVVVTAGPTREPLDPVRFISNRSSGRMGIALARVARRRGAEVTLICGPVAVPPPPGVRVLGVGTAAEMGGALEGAFKEATIVVMAAAVADFRPGETLKAKRPRAEKRWSVELEPVPDLLADLARRKGTRLLVGFAAETGGAVAKARTKLAAKGVDLMVANDVTRPGAGFDVDTNVVAFVDGAGRVEELPLLSKEDVADRLFDRLRALRVKNAPAKPSAV